MTPNLAPPAKSLWAAELPRALWAVAQLMPPKTRARLNAAPRGDGRPVMLLPGLSTVDASNVVMRRYLEKLGYHAVGWGLGRNLGAKSAGADGELLIERVRALHDETGERVTLIGVSLGGMMARHVAHAVPELVREVITVSSPYAGDPHATNVWRAFEWLTGEKVDDAEVIARRENLARPLPVPATAIWSRSDGMVSGLICHAEDEVGCRAIEVRSSHLGVQMHPDVLRAIADVLGGDED